MCDACGPVRGGGLRLRGHYSPGIAARTAVEGGGLRVRTVRWRRLLVVVVVLLLVLLRGRVGRGGLRASSAAPAQDRLRRRAAVAGAVERGSRAGRGTSEGGLARSCVVRAVLASAAFRGPLPSLHKPLQFFKFFSAWGFLGLVA